MAMAELEADGAAAQPCVVRDGNCELVADSRKRERSFAAEEELGLDAERRPLDPAVAPEIAACERSGGDFEGNRQEDQAGSAEEKKLEGDGAVGKSLLDDDGAKFLEVVEEEKLLEPLEESKLEEKLPNNDDQGEEDGETKRYEDDERVRDDGRIEEQTSNDEADGSGNGDETLSENRDMPNADAATDASDAAADDSAADAPEADAAADAPKSDAAADAPKADAAADAPNADAAADPPKPALRTFERRRKVKTERKNNEEVSEKRAAQKDAGDAKESRSGEETKPEKKKLVVKGEKKILKRPRQEDGGKETKVVKKPKEVVSLKDKLSEGGEGSPTEEKSSKIAKETKVRPNPKLVKTKSDAARKNLANDSKDPTGEKTVEKKIRKRPASDNGEPKVAKKVKAAKEVKPVQKKKESTQDSVKHPQEKKAKPKNVEPKPESKPESKPNKSTTESKVKRVKLSTERPNLFRSDSGLEKKEVQAAAETKVPIEDTGRTPRPVRVEPQALSNEAISTPVPRLLDGGGNKVREAYEAAKELKQRRQALKEEMSSSTLKILRAAAETPPPPSTSPVFKEPTPEDSKSDEKSKIELKKSRDKEKGIALETFQGMLETLTRAKDSIQKTTLFAMECAHKGVAKQVMDVILRKLKKEQDNKKRVDLLFLVDSMAQYHHHKGGPDYASIVENCLVRFLTAVAPPGSPSENRIQCVKVVRLWVERKIMKERILNDTIDRLGMDTNLNTTQRQYQRQDRAFHDPIREMGTDMFVDEYGSNTSFQLPGFLVRKSDDEEYEEMDAGVAAQETETSPLPNGTTHGLRDRTSSPPPPPPPLPSHPPPSPPPRPPSSPPPPPPPPPPPSTGEKRMRSRWQ